MGDYLLKRILLLVPMTLGITLITFLIVRQAGATSDEGADATQGLRTERGGTVRDKMMADQFGRVDSPLIGQYWTWLSRAAQGNLGESLNDGRPVMGKIVEALKVTLFFNLVGLILVYAGAIPIGMYSATHPGTRVDTLSSLCLYLLFSMPSFWVAIQLIRFIGSSATGLGWLPYNGVHPDGWERLTTLEFLFRALPYTVLPLMAMTYNQMAGLSRYARVGMIEVVRADFIRTARAKGLNETQIMFRHALPNSLIPLITLLAGLLPGMIGGSVIVESIFAIPGMGKLGYEAVLQRDYTVLMAVTTFAALLTMVGILLSDLLLAAVDPRIALHKGAGE